MDRKKTEPQGPLAYNKMSGTELKGRIRQINRLLVKVRIFRFMGFVALIMTSNLLQSMKQPNLDADLISKKQQQLAELQNELNTRPPSHVVVEENIRRIKERNATKVVKNPTIVYAGTFTGLLLF